MSSQLHDYEIRGLSQDEMKDFFKLERYVFADNDIPTEEEESKNPLKREWTQAAFHKGKLVATSAGFPFKMQLNGQPVRADGVTAVGTEPGHRRRGLVRKMIVDRLHKAHENGVPASILWASVGAIYQRFGYGLGSSSLDYRFDPRYASFQFGEAPTGYVDRLDCKSALPIMQELYDRFIADRNLALHRPSEVWQLALEEKRNFHVAIHYDSMGNHDGFLRYRINEFQSEGVELNQRMHIRDFTYLNSVAYRALWEFIRSHDLVGDVRVDVPLDDPALLMLLEPRVLQPKWNEGIWLRVVDVTSLASSRNYSESGFASFEIVEDPDCPWNIGKYLIESDGQSSQVSQYTQDVDFRISVNGLSSLLTGQAPLSKIAMAGRAEVIEDRRLAELDQFFSTKYLPYCPDGF